MACGDVPRCGVCGLYVYSLHHVCAPPIYGAAQFTWIAPSPVTETWHAELDAAWNELLVELDLQPARDPLKAMG